MTKITFDETFKKSFKGRGQEEPERTFYQKGSPKVFASLLLKGCGGNLGFPRFGGDVMQKLFKQNYGIIPACDVNTLEELTRIVNETHDLDGIVGYKIGCELGLSFGLGATADIIKNICNLSVIYDHQKASTDIPQLGEKFADVCKKAGIDGVIIFPQSGPETEEAFIKAIISRGMVPLVGGEMTHPRYLTRDGGFIIDYAPHRMYEIGAKNGAEYFIVPGNKPDVIKEYSEFLSKIVKEPKFCMPGIGTQGGEIEISFKSTLGNPAYAIIGSAIYKQKDMREAAKKFSDIALEFNR